MKTLDPKKIKTKGKAVPRRSIHFDVDTAGKVLAASNALLELLELSRDKVVGKSFGLFLPGPDRQAFLEDLAYTARNCDESVRSRWRILKSHGKLAHFSCVLRLSSSQVINITAEEVAGPCQDQHNEPPTKDLFEFFFDTETYPVLVTDQDHTIKRYNHSFKSYFGLGGNEINEQNIADLTDFPPGITHNGILIHSKNGEIFKIRKRMIDAAGQPYWIWNFTPFADLPAGQPTQRPGEENGLYAALMQQSLDSIFLVDTQALRVVDANNALTNILGYTREELLQLTFYDLLHAEHDSVIKQIDQVRNEDRFLCEHQYRGKDGQVIPMEASGTKIKAGSGELLCIIARDITERKKAEKAQDKYKKYLESRVAERTRALRQSSEELSQFAYIAAHDLKTPLRAISSIVSWLAHDYKDKFDQKGKAQLRLLIDRTRRMHNFIDGISSYTSIGKKNDPPKEVDLDKIINHVIAQYNVIYPSATIVLDNPLEPVLYYQAAAEQVFINLVENALRHNNKPRPHIQVGSKPNDGKTVYYVNDNGPGIPQKYQKKIFKMFQTLATKDEKESIGIGLTIAKKIIESNGGKIWLESSEHSGTTFYFSLT